MELEAKYRLPGGDIPEMIWQDEDLAGRSEESRLFDGIYYDTEGQDLTRARLVVRVRKEGEETVLTLKGGGRREGAVHMRDEFSVPLPAGMAKEELPEKLSLKEVREALWEEIRREPIAAILSMFGDDSILLPMIRVTMTRRTRLIDTGSAVVELALDEGVVAAGGGEDPICEMEMELKEGDPMEVISLSERTAIRYGLVPETRSKFARGLALLAGTK